MSEIWRAVVGREGEYEVSDHGRVRSLDRERVCTRTSPGGRTTTFRQKWPGKMIALDKQASGHVTVRIGRAKEKRYVHRLMLESFVGPCPPGMEGLHKDDVPDHNVLDNLSWGTRGQNLRDAVRNGKKPVGEACSFSKLKASDIPVIRRRLETEGPTAIARSYGLKRGTIVSIRDGRNWKHVA